MLATMKVYKFPNSLRTPRHPLTKTTAICMRMQLMRDVRRIVCDLSLVGGLLSLHYFLN